ncbi:MFS transporter prlL [Golovinomyces cichoracearum]|uniref:MFS transporter prlL n=1 Tax=Golovinomyces cichoracearum TaxID=62708 RepID=A0A420H8B5_9PEZI|nr:MFS transporter prlL [Golovinomyces cichoracearum]
MASISEMPECLKDKSDIERAELEKTLKYKIDRRLIPMVVIMYIMNHLDRGNIAAARLAGLPEDLNLKGSEFQLAVSILFAGYMLMQIPSNLFLNKIGKPALHLPCCMLIWGLISACMAASQNFYSLFICRLLLGFAEAAYFPGCLFYLSCWYTRKELSFRTAIFYSGSIISGAISGLVSSGVTAHMDGYKGLRAWRWLFILEGITTVIVASLSFIILPNFPRTTSWLTHEEQELAMWRLQEDVGGGKLADESKQSFFTGLKMACTDVKIYVLMVLIYGFAASSSVVTFFPTVVKTLNYNRVKTLLLTTPPFALAVVTTYLNAWHADRSNERFYHIVIPLSIALVSFIINIAVTSIGARYFSMIIMLPSIFSGQVVALSWVSNCIPESPAKRAAALAVINSVANSALVYTSFMYYDKAAPHYFLAMGYNGSMVFFSFVAAVVMRKILINLNRQHEENEISSSPTIGISRDRKFAFTYVI